MSKHLTNWHAALTRFQVWQLSAQANRRLLLLELEPDDNDPVEYQVEAWSQLRKWQLAERD